MNKKGLLVIAVVMAAAVAIAGALVASSAPRSMPADTTTGGNPAPGESPRNHVINVTDSMELDDKQ